MTVSRLRQKEPKSNASRFEVFLTLDQERKYQDTLNDGRILSIGEEILLIEEYAVKARAEWTLSFEGVEWEALEHVRKMAAIALRCLEHHGAPERVVPAAVKKDWIGK